MCLSVESAAAVFGVLVVLVGVPVEASARLRKILRVRGDVRAASAAVR